MLNVITRQFDIERSVIVVSTSVGSNLVRFGGSFGFLRFGRFEVRVFGTHKRFGRFEVRF